MDTNGERNNVVRSRLKTTSDWCTPRKLQTSNVSWCTGKYGSSLIIQEKGKILKLFLSACSGFGWHRVNSHKNPGGDTAGPADPNWPNKQGIRHPVMSRWEPLLRCESLRALLCVLPCSDQYCCCYCSPPLLCRQTVLIPTHDLCLLLPILLPTLWRRGHDRARFPSHVPK